MRLVLYTCPEVFTISRSNPVGSQKLPLIGMPALVWLYSLGSALLDSEGFLSCSSLATRLCDDEKATGP